MTESQLLIDETHIPEVRSALGQASYHLETNHGFSSEEAREWILQEARAKKASLESVAKAIVAGRKVEYRASQASHTTLPTALVLPDDGFIDLSGLTTGRCRAALPFGGKYRLIDFALSNCVNSGLETVGVVTQSQPATLNAHQAPGRPWSLDRCEGGLALLHPYQTRRSSAHDSGIDWYAGTAHAIYQNQESVFRHRADQTLILYGSEIYTMDLSVLAAQHRENGAELTVAAARVAMGTSGRYHTLIVDRGGQVRDVLPPGSSTPGPLAAMGVLLFSTDALCRRLNEDMRQVGSSHDLLSDLIPRMICDGDRVLAFQHTGHWATIHTAYDYWRANLDLLSGKPNIYDRSWPLRNQTEAHPPAHISQTAKVTHSLICAGCIIEGTVEHSVLSPGVYVGPGAVLRNAVVLHNTRVQESAWVENAILDMDVVVGTQAQVGSAHLGTPPQNRLQPCPITIVPKGTRVHAKESVRADVLSKNQQLSIVEGR